MPEPPAPTLALHLDRAALAANWRALDRLSGTARAGAAVKADAYGLGVDHVVPVLHAAGARDFFVAHWSEVADVLRHVPPSQVSVLHGPMTAEEAAYARATGVRPVINSLHQAQMWQQAGGGACDLMIDTGINRLGVPMREIRDSVLAALDVEVLMSHLACADQNHPMNALQLARFDDAAAAIPARSRSMANSAGVALGTAYAFDLTRPGLALYGGIPCAALVDEIRQVAWPKVMVMQLRNLEPGESVGYDALFTAPAAMRVAVVAIGYADGFLRSRGGSALRHDGRDLPVLGKVSMDMVVADCTAAPGVREGDWLDVPFDLRAIAAASGLSQYEVLTTLGRRFRR